jgi:pimeloyl-ACP methyl ester carboxylesterase
MRGEFVDVGGVRLYYYAAGTRGAGEPLVLIHGLFTSSRLWASVVPCLPPGHRTVILDLLGHGRSDPPTPPSDLSVAGHAARLVTLLDTLGVTRACLAGHGIGATIAQAVAVLHPTRVTKLALFNPVPLGDGATAAGTLLSALLPTAGAVPGPLLLGAVRRRIAAGYPTTPRTDRQLTHFLRPFQTPAGRDAMVDQLRALAAGGDAELAAKPMPAIPTVIVGDSGHYTPEESPEFSATTIRHLLEQ